MPQFDNLCPNPLQWNILTSSFLRVLKQFCKAAVSKLDTAMYSAKKQAGDCKKQKVLLWL